MVDWSPELRRALCDELTPDERVEWQSVPDPLMGAAADWPLLPFGGVWFVVCAYGFGRSIESGIGMSTVVGAIFTAIGGYLVTRPVAAWSDQRQTAFAITNRRLIVLRKGGRSITSILRRGIRQIERIEKAGRVTLRIPTQVVTDSDGDRMAQQLVMYGLRNGDVAYRLLTSPSNESA